VLATFTFANMLETLLTIFFMVIYFIILFNVIGDLFRDHKLSGAAKTLWIVALLFVPLLSLIVYLIARGGGMSRRAVEAHQEMQRQLDAYVQQTAAGANPADQIAQAKKLLDDGTITQQEFDAIKAKALA